MEREHVALAQQAAELDPSGPPAPLELGPRAARRVEDPQSERHRPAAHRLADASGPEQAERPALRSVERRAGKAARGRTAATMRSDANWASVGLVDRTSAN